MLLRKISWEMVHNTFELAWLHSIANWMEFIAQKVADDRVQRSVRNASTTLCLPGFATLTAKMISPVSVLKTSVVGLYTAATHSGHKFGAALTRNSMLQTQTQILTFEAAKNPPSYKSDVTL